VNVWLVEKFLKVVAIENGCVIVLCIGRHPVEQLLVSDGVAKSCHVLENFYGVLWREVMLMQFVCRAVLARQPVFPPEGLHIFTLIEP